MNTLKFAVVAAILVFACAIGLSAYLPVRFDTGDQVRMSDFPMSIGEWKGTDIPLSKLDYEILETTNLIMRQYKNAQDRRVTLYIVYSNDNRKVSHPPEVCYLGSGAAIVDKGTLNVSPGIRANKMIADMAGGRQLVVYWYKAGDLFTERYFEQQMRIAWRRILGKKTSAALIRVSVDIKEGEEAGSRALVQSFSAAIAPLLSRFVP